jgi:hypothetical protein
MSLHRCKADGLVIRSLREPAVSRPMIQVVALLRSAMHQSRAFTSSKPELDAVHLEIPQ